MTVYHRGVSEPGQPASGHREYCGINYRERVTAPQNPWDQGQPQPPQWSQPGAGPNPTDPYQQPGNQELSYPDPAYTQPEYRDPTYHQPGYQQPGGQISAPPGVPAPPVSGPAAVGDTLSYPADPNAYGAYPAAAVPPVVHSGELVHPASMPVLVQIGEIQVTATHIRTPLGEAPLRGSTWIAQDQWVTSQKTPTWAIVCAILGFFCLTIFSLLFLLAKETVYTGHVTVVVTSGQFQYQTRIPVYDQNQAQYVQHQVNYARAVANQ